MKFSFAILSITAALLVAHESRAQSGYAATEINRLGNRSSPANFSVSRIVGTAVTPPRPSLGLGHFTSSSVSTASMGRANKPFSSISKGPSVTPYLALDNPFTSPATSYYTQIRPQMEQQRVNQQQERQNQLMQRQISQYTAIQPFDPTGSETRAPTGHASAYMNYGGYYTTPAAGSRRR
jgi:hypothetical protein